MNDSELKATYRIEDCTKCKNECAAACPIYRHYGTYHPQQLAHLFLSGGESGARDHRLIWTCMTCRACTEACPFKVEFADFIRALRVGRADYAPAFGGLIHQYQRMQAGAAAGPRNVPKGSRDAARAAKARLSWIDDSLKTNTGGDVVLFTGCLALFDAVSAGSCGDGFGGIGRAAVRILNRIGVSPTILDDERCCGRDLLDIGDRGSFEQLARHNLSEIKKSKATKVLTICPECAYTIRETYAREIGKHALDVQHISEFIAGKMGTLSFKPGEERFAFHDPCYLCRYLGVTDAPRALLGALTSQKLVELVRRGAGAPCCGAASWVNHGPHTRTAVNERLKEAHAAGAQVLVTACPKCTLLYAEVNPACSWKQSPVVVRDLLTLAASRLKE
jgi:heterodisulfide reductase subunit D